MTDIVHLSSKYLQRAFYNFMSIKYGGQKIIADILHLPRKYYQPVDPTIDEALEAREYFFTKLHETFEKSAQCKKYEKLNAIVGNCILFSGPITALVIPPISPAFAIAQVAIAATLSAKLGHETIKSASHQIAQAKSEYSKYMHDYFFYTAESAHHEMTREYVTDINRDVRHNKKISMHHLAKLITIDETYFQDACNKLAITVLQAKLMVAMQNEDIQPFAIPHSGKNALHFTIPENNLRAILKDKFQNATSLKTPDDNQHIFENEKNSKDPPFEPSPHTAKTIMTAVYRFYADGLKGHARAFQKPKANDHLPTMPAFLNPTELLSVQDLEDRIQSYGVEKLDLPALARA